MNLVLQKNIKFCSTNTYTCFLSTYKVSLNNTTIGGLDKKDNPNTIKKKPILNYVFVFFCVHRIFIWTYMFIILINQKCSWNFLHIYQTYMLMCVLFSDSFRCQKCILLKKNPSSLEPSHRMHFSFSKPSIFCSGVSKW